MSQRIALPPEITVFDEDFEDSVPSEGGAEIRETPTQDDSPTVIIPLDEAYLYYPRSRDKA